MSTPTPPNYINDWPLRRLIEVQDPAERFAGPNSPTVRVLARIVYERVSKPRRRDQPTAPKKGAAHA